MGANEFNIPAPIKPNGKFPVAYSSDILGAMHIVDNEAAMLAIPQWKRTVGTECYVISSKKKYRLINNPTTDDTVLSDWEVDSGTDPSILDKYVTKEEWEHDYEKLITKIDDEYVSLVYLKNNYLSARQMMDKFITREEISAYATVEQLENISHMLSRVMTNVLPASIIRVEQGTEEIELGLPTGMTITFSDGTYYLAPVTWNSSSYDKDLVGYQYIEGVLSLPSFVIGRGDIPNLNKTHVVVQVYKKGEEPPVPVDKSDISGFEPVANIGVIAGTPWTEITLPGFVSAEVLDSTGEISFLNVPVIWDTEDAPEAVYGAMTLRGTVDTGEELTNLLNLKPKLNIIIQGPYGEPHYEYRQVMYLNAGESELSGGYIPSLTNDLFYGVGNLLKQRKVDIRFLGFVDEQGNDLIPEFAQTYPYGIRVPVSNSPDSDVASYLNKIKAISELIGYPIEYDVPGGCINPRVSLDDESHRIIFNSPSIYKAKFLLSKSDTYNLPYPDTH